MSDTESFLPEHPPVTDWVNDFDHTDPRWTEDPFPIWQELRAHAPVVHTERFLGCYMPTTYEAVRAIANDSEHFSSRRIIVRDIRPEQTAKAPPITSDPPEHKPAKQVLLPPFTPDAMKKTGAAGARDLQRADRRVHRRRQMRRCGALHQAHSGARHRPHARHSGEGRRSLHPMDPRDPRARHQGARKSWCTPRPRWTRTSPAISSIARRIRPTT